MSLDVEVMQNNHIILIDLNRHGSLRICHHLSDTAQSLSMFHSLLGRDVQWDECRIYLWSPVENHDLNTAEASQVVPDRKINFRFIRTMLSGRSSYRVCIFIGMAVFVNDFS